MVSRILFFVKPELITVFSNASTHLFEVTDVINAAAANALRGENYEVFGPRFNDLSHVISGRRFK